MDMEETTLFKGFGVLSNRFSKKVLNEELKQKTKKEEKNIKLQTKLLKSYPKLKLPLKQMFQKMEKNFLDQ